MDAKQIIKHYDQLKTERSLYSDLWQTIAKYTLPRKAYITKERKPGEKYAYDVYDSTAIQANLVLAAGFHSYMTNPSSKWFALKMQDRTLMESQDVKVWLKDTEDRVYDTLNGSNFAQQIHETYLDLGCFGTSGLYEEEDEKDIVRFFSWPIGNLYIAENERERVDIIYRDFKYTARQAYERWKDKAGETVRKAIEKGEDFKPVTFIHCIMPRYERDVSKTDAKNMPFVSYYVEKEKQEIISEGGYLEFPCFVPRFNKHNDDAYGSSPAMVSLPDILQLNKMDETIIRASQIVIDPPISVPHDGFMLPIKWGPRGVNYKTSINPYDKIEPLLTGANIPIGLEMEEQRRTIIKQNFFVDLFLLLAQKGKMTATEVLQRVEEKMLILAPTLGRLMSELLDPIITRTINILARQNKLKPLPFSLQGKNYVIEYISPLARAQKLSESKSINNFLLALDAISNKLPEVLDKINGDKLVDALSDLNNVPPNLIRDDKEVANIREARAEAQKMQLELEMAKTGMGALKDASQAQKNIKPEAK